MRPHALSSYNYILDDTCGLYTIWYTVSMKLAASSHAQKSVGNKIIYLILALCVCVLMSGLVVQSQLMDAQVKFYRTALAYCYENDCTDFNTDKSNIVTNNTTANVESETGDSSAEEGDQ